MKILPIVSILLSAVTHAQFGRIDSSLVPTPIYHFQPEYTFDRPIDTLAWAKEKAGLHTSFASTDEAYSRTEVPQIMNKQTWEAVGWRGERLNAMILVWSSDSISQLRLSVKDLKDAKGNVLSRNNFKLNIVRYVLSNDPYNAGDVYCGEDQMNKIFLLPDRLESFDRFDLPARSVRPIWLSLDIPANMLPGSYRGSIEIRSDTRSAVLDLQIKVQPQILPKPHDWKFRLDLWQNPWIIASYYGLKPWSEEHKQLLRKHLKLYADAGGKFITANVVHAVWADDTYGSLVEWNKTKNGTWKFDYSFFDQYVQLAIETGVDKAITIYSPIPDGESFRYFDEKTGNYVYERWQPTSDTFKTNWTAFLNDLKAHLEKKGWFDRTYIGINENAPEQMLSAIRLIKNNSGKWKITYAGDWHTELDTLLDDYCSIYGKEPQKNDVIRRNGLRRTSTFYVCCTPQRPNNFVFSPPVESRWIGWYAYAHGYDGFLRWAYDSWPADVMHDARNIHWNGPAGDCYMVYPGANSSIRLEKLREGIVDYEKLRILRTMDSRSKGKTIQTLAAELEQLLSRINNERELKKERLVDDISRGKKVIEDLSDALSIPGK
jgi:hypothetical protein